MTGFMPETFHELELESLEVQKDVIRMIHQAGSGHPGSSLSCVNTILALYHGILRFDPARPDWEDRDRFVLSKGHAVPTLYAVLAHKGCFPREELMTLRHLGSRLQGHPDRKRFPLLEASTGSLGQGLSIGIGMALAAPILKKDYHTFVLIGDGEAEEGQIWEAVAYAGYHRVPRLTCIVDENGFQLDDSTKSILYLEPFAEKFRCFGWEAVEIDGHDFKAIFKALEESRKPGKKPTAIIAHTVKGKGVSFMENNNHFHGVAPNDDECKRALAELDQAIAKLRSGAGSGGK